MIENRHEPNAEKVFFFKTKNIKRKKRSKTDRRTVIFSSLRTTPCVRHEILPIFYSVTVLGLNNLRAMRFSIDPGFGRTKLIDRNGRLTFQFKFYKTIFDYLHVSPIYIFIHTHESPGVVAVVWYTDLYRNGLVARHRFFRLLCSVRPTKFVFSAPVRAPSNYILRIGRYHADYSKNYTYN